MANIACNTYLFYGDRTELEKCHGELSKLYEKFGNRLSCVDRDNDVHVNCEWIECVEELGDDTDEFWMDTASKWYGNPVYWNNWVKTNFPKLSMAFRCEEPGMGVFEMVDPDNRLGEYIYLHGKDIPKEDLEKLPKVIRNTIYDDNCLWGTFGKDEVFSKEFQPSDMPDSIVCAEYTNTTYEEIEHEDEVFQEMLSNMKENFNNQENKGV